MRNWLRAYWPLLVSTLAFTAVLVGILIATEREEPRTPADPKPTPTAVAAPVGDLQIEPERSAVPGVPETTLRDETPDEVSPETLEQGQQENERLAGEQLLDPLPVGGAQNYDLRKKFGCGVYSDRSYPAVQFVLHFTVSSNRPGWDDVYGIHDYFCRTRIASSTYIQDFDCHTLQMVPESKKPWTQGAFNGASISVEIIATGSETRAQWLAADIFKKGCLSGLARDSMRRNGIRIVRVDPVGCTAKVGYTDHNALECGNDHTDVGRNFPWDVFSDQLRDPVATCGKRCRAIKRRHRATHERITKERCRPLGKAKREVCVKLRQREARQHERAKRVWGLDL